MMIANCVDMPIMIIMIMLLLLLLLLLILILVVKRSACARQTQRAPIRAHGTMHVLG
jgi:hypothetical protein